MSMRTNKEAIIISVIRKHPVISVVGSGAILSH